jgi:hypothetical protein
VNRLDAKITVELDNGLTPALTMRKTIEFTPDGVGVLYQKWGSFSANFWFTARIGKTPRITCANAVKRLRHLTKQPSKITYEVYDVQGN